MRALHLERRQTEAKQRLIMTKKARILRDKSIKTQHKRKSRLSLSWGMLKQIKTWHNTLRLNYLFIGKLASNIETVPFLRKLNIVILKKLLASIMLQTPDTVMVSHVYQITTVRYLHMVQRR